MICISYNFSIESSFYFFKFSLRRSQYFNKYWIRSFFRYKLTYENSLFSFFEILDIKLLKNKIIKKFCFNSSSS